MAGAPHVPGGDGAVGAPAFSEGEKLFGRGHMFFVVGDGPAFFDPEVVDGENVGAAEAEDEEHLDGPGADAADGGEALDEVFVGELAGVFEGGDDAVEGFLREIFEGEDFCVGETGFAERGLAEFEDFVRCGDFAVGAESFDAGEDRSGGLAGDGLMGDGFEEGFVGRFDFVFFQGEGDGFFDKALQIFVASGEVLNRSGEVEA